MAIGRKLARLFTQACFVEIGVNRGLYHLFALVFWFDQIRVAAVIFVDYFTFFVVNIVIFANIWNKTNILQLGHHSRFTSKRLHLSFL